MLEFITMVATQAPRITSKHPAKTAGKKKRRSTASPLSTISRPIGKRELSSLNIPAGTADTPPHDPGGSSAHFPGGYPENPTLSSDPPEQEHWQEPGLGQEEPTSHTAVNESIILLGKAMQQQQAITAQIKQQLTTQANQQALTSQSLNSKFDMLLARINDVNL
ncbi:MAG: hypothetical protein Q9202_007648 [Teloschistes flavicans]